MAAAGSSFAFESSSSTLPAAFSTFATTAKAPAGVTCLVGEDGRVVLFVISLLILLAPETGTALSENREGSLRFRVGREAPAFSGALSSLSATSTTSSVFVAYQKVRVLVKSGHSVTLDEVPVFVLRVDHALSAKDRGTGQRQCKPVTTKANDGDNTPAIPCVP